MEKGEKSAQGDVKAARESLTEWNEAGANQDTPLIFFFNKTNEQVVVKHRIEATLSDVVEGEVASWQIKFFRESEDKTYDATEISLPIRIEDTFDLKHIVKLEGAIYKYLVEKASVIQTVYVLDELATAAIRSLDDVGPNMYGGKLASTPESVVIDLIALRGEPGKLGGVLASIPRTVEYTDADLDQ